MGTSPITVPADPFELIAPDGRRYGMDLDAMGVHVLASRCGELGPSRLSPGVPERNCEVFTVPESALVSATLQPSAAAHRNLLRPLIDLGAIAFESAAQPSSRRVPRSPEESR